MLNIFTMDYDELDYRLDWREMRSFMSVSDASIQSAVISANATADAARTTARLALAGAFLSVLATLAGTWMTIKSTQTTEKEKILNSIIQMAAGSSGITTSQIAVCNIALWRDAGLIDKELGDKIVQAFKDQREATTERPKCKI
jgi:Na+(H+)/acetate symporter ActP